MKKLVFVLAIIAAGISHAEEQPPYETAEPEISENFRQIYYQNDDLKNTTVKYKDATREYNVRDYGAYGNGTTDDTTAIQNTITAAGANSVIYFPYGTYRINRSSGTNDRWGLLVTTHNVTLKGDGAKLRRYDINLSTWSYPILFIGTPDSNTAPATMNTTVDGLVFVGEDTRHDSAGSIIHDGRCAIELKNTSGANIKNCRFDDIDSQAIYFQKPNDYDYFRSVNYNTTKNYHAKIAENTFYGREHATSDRALMHAIAGTGIDDLIVTSNYFEWCDNAIAQETTYANPHIVEDNLYDPGTGVGSIRPTGRGVVFSNNSVLNSSEHSVYFGGMDITVAGNTFRVDNTTVCPLGDIKLRAVNVAIAGNTLTCGSQCISVNEPSSNISIAGNTMYAKTDGGGGVININSDGLSSYIASRSFYDVGSSSYFPMIGIQITGNVIEQRDVSQTYGIGVRILTDSSDSNYPDGQIQDIVIAGNTFRHTKDAILFFGPMTQWVNITGNIFHAKSFTLAAFSSSTAMLTESIVNVYRTDDSVLTKVKFNNNTVYGSSTVFRTDNNGGTSVNLPYGISDNRFNYVQRLSGPDFRSPAVFNQFKNNTGSKFFYRGWDGSSVGNSLFGGDGSDNESKRYTLFYDGATLKFYVDDAGNTINLN